MIKYEKWMKILGYIKDILGFLKTLLREF